MQLMIIISVNTNTDQEGKENTTEQSWTAHVLSYFFFMTFSFLDSIQYFSCEHPFLQNQIYKILIIRQIVQNSLNSLSNPNVLLDVSEVPNKLDLIKKGIFALNKFIIRTFFPSWDVCETLGIFPAQGHNKSLLNISV